MSRKDKLTRQLSAPERRPRRNLSDFPRVSLGTAVPDDPDVGGCPNLAPPDAAVARCTIKNTAETAGTPYADVYIDNTGLVPGADVISYCFEGLVGPPGGNILISCDGTFALTVDGLITKELVNGVLEPGFWDRWRTKGGEWNIKWDAVAGQYFLRGHNLNYLAFDQECDYLINQVAPDLDTITIQCRVRFNEYGYYWYEEGGGWWSGTGTRAGGAGVVGAWVPDPIIPIEQDTCYLAMGFQGFGGARYTALGRYNGLVYTGLGGLTNFTDQPTLFIEDDYQEAYFVNAGQTGSPATATDAVNKDIPGRAGLLITASAYNSTGYNSWAEYQDIYICTTKRITVTGVPTGYWVALVNYEDNPVMDAGPETLGTTVFNSDSTTDPVGGTGLQYHRWPFRGFRVYDAKPSGQGGTGSLVLECIPQRGVFPGDTWNLDINGGQITGDPSVIDAQATIQLILYDKDDQVVATYEPTGTNLESYTRTADTQYLNIPIPWYMSGGYLRFTPYKRGTGDGYACVRNLQVNVGGDVCCDFTIPGSDIAIQGALSAAGLSAVADQDVVLADVDGDGVQEPHIVRVLDESRYQPYDPDLPAEEIGDKFWTGEQIGDSWFEHRQGNLNLMGFDAHAERDGPPDGGVGNPPFGKGYGYDPIDVEDFGIIPGTDVISIRFKGKVV